MMKKMLFGLAIAGLVLMAALLMISPPETEAQGWVEYNLCGDFPEEAVYISCKPVFKPKKDGQFVAMKKCIFHYEDIDGSENFTPGDTLQDEPECQRISFQ